ncbi:MAG: alkaline phosphatase [Colwellia sp.]|nr:alkaline phosphatase [Colwellia sp.]
MKHFLPILLLSLSTASCVSTETSKQEIIPKKNTVPKNIIMVIGDGMGPAYTSAYRYFSDNPNTEMVEKTVFDRHLIGLSSTYPAAISGVVTDSAASATALATGIKSYNGAIGVDVNKKSVQSVLEWAKLQGKATGVIVTSQINHATPASYLTHNENRKNYNAIADSYIDDGIKADLYLGGGWQYFIREDRNIVDDFKQAGFHYLDNYQGLSKLPNNKPVLGLFANAGLPAALDDTNKHRLSAMTKAGVHHLVDYQNNTTAENQGFFLLVEASQIDWAGHNNDISGAMAEMDDLAKTLEYLEHFVEHHPDTLVIVTADHSTGGFTIGTKGKYLWQPDKLRSMKHSPTYIAKELVKNKITPAIAATLFNFELSNDDITLLIHSKNTAILNNITKIKKLQSTSTLEFSLALTIKQIMNKYSYTGWTSGGHTAIDVPVFAFGKRSELFGGYQDNTDIAKKIFSLLGKKL